MAKFTPFDFSANDVWAAAAKAQRINGRYLKQNQWDDGKETITNRQLMLRYLEEPHARLALRDKHDGAKVRQYFQGLVFKMISGEYMSEFDKSAGEVAQKERIDTTYDLAVIASLPGVYAKAIVRDAQNRRIRSLNNNKTLGKIGERMDLTVEVLKSVYSQKWGVYYTTCVTPNEEVLYFASANINPKPGLSIKIRGTVKQHRVSDDGTQTQFNRVKVDTGPKHES
jgi:hypothetical protein